MKKAILFFALVGLTLGACNSNNAGKSAHIKKGRYTCPMHPDVFSDKPGLCPRCGMDMVERDTTGDK